MAATVEALGGVDLPLVVDLDGTLIRTDLLVESAFAHVGEKPMAAIGVLAALRRGKAALKDHIAAQTTIDVAHLPYDEAVLDLIRRAKGEGRRVILASASNERYVKGVAEHLGLFDEWYGSSATDNLSSSRKAALLVEKFGEKGFDYIGNERADIPIWRVARKAIGVRLSGSLESHLKVLAPDAEILPSAGNPLRAWAKMLRVHQWAKNALVFVAPLTSQHLNFGTLGQILAAFFAFSLAASAIYIVNDLVDIDADRKHPSKKRRPLAAGTVPILEAVVVAPALLIAALALAATLPSKFILVVLAYLALTTLYTFVLKRKMMIDVVALAALYTLRVIGGAEAIAVPVSEWLLGFSMFIFTALALVKRYIELAARLDADLPDPTNRNYRKADLPVILAMASAASFNAITVFALYVSSPAVNALYAHPRRLWLMCPVLLFWLGRVLMLAHRRMMDDDPIVFAIKDSRSYAAAAMAGLIIILSATL
ncbi:MAG: UbiA family prenyltransferase [Proteobacteria bacterium]|nr:UbiA family prenyltransferase [Pseudomonadota bacterium]